MATSRVLNSRLTALRRLATGPAASVASGVAMTNVLRIVSSMTLTRLLDAHAYGVVGIMTSIAYMLGMLSDVGLYAFIVRHREGDDPRFLDQVWTLRLMRGLGLSALMAVLARPLAGLLAKPDIAPVIAVWGLGFAIEGFSSLAFATGVRAQRLWRLSFLDLSNTIGQFVVSIAIALLWRSYWALVIGNLAGSLLKMALSYALFAAARRRWSFDRPRSRELWAFSRNIALSSMLSLLILQSDKVVLARLMPLATYGFYAIATTLAAAPVALAIPFATRVLFAVYSRTARENRAGLRGVFYRRRRRAVLLYMAGVAAMIGAAPLLVAILYDRRYGGVAPFLQIIAIASVLRMPCLAATQVLFAIGRTRAQLVANVFRVAWLAAGGIVALIDRNVMLLLWTVGLVEVPALICFWITLAREKLLNLVEEIYGLVAAAAGGALGWAVGSAGLALLGR